MGTSVHRLSFFVSSGRILREKADCKQSSLKQKLISDICLKQGIDFIIFCLNQGIDFINFFLKLDCLQSAFSLKIRPDETRKDSL